MCTLRLIQSTHPDKHVKGTLANLIANLCVVSAVVPIVSAHELYVPTRVYYMAAGQLAADLEQATGMSPGLRNTTTDLINGHEGMAFVDGVTDAVQGTVACTTPQQRTQVLALTAAYLRGQPERRDEPAAKLVIEALKMHFPCPTTSTKR
jgi:hypothetical protein